MIKFVPREFDKKKVYQAETVSGALEIAGKISPVDNLICVSGSLYLVGEARKFLAVNSKQKQSAL